MQTTSNFLQQAQLLQNDLVTLRRHIHAHPELSFQEKATAKLGAEYLSKLGFQITEGVGKTGVVANLGTGFTVAIRADMDALPIQEVNGYDFISKNPGVMHACGHDAHVACALTAAKILSQEKLPGKIRFILQPAEENSDEEGKSGAARMIEDGVMKNVSAVIGLHVDAELPAGCVGIVNGPIMAAADGFRLTITGKGGHGAYPERTVDSVIIASQIIVALQQIVSRKISALDAGILTVGSVQSSSSRGNVISDSVTLLGTIRSFNETTRQKLLSELDHICQIARIMGGDYSLQYELGYPPTVNDPKIAQVMRQAACDLIGAQNVISIAPKTWAEDFSLLAQQAPGAFMFLGAEIKGNRRSHHSPDFDLDESGLYIGSAILAETAKRLLSTNNQP